MLEISSENVKIAEKDGFEFFINHLGEYLPYVILNSIGSILGIQMNFDHIRSNIILIQ